MPSLSLVSYPHATCFLLTSMCPCFGVMTQLRLSCSLCWSSRPYDTAMALPRLCPPIHPRAADTILVGLGSKVLSASPSLHSLEMHFIVAKLIMSRRPEGRDPHATASLWLHHYPDVLTINLSCTQIPLGLFTIRSRLPALPHCLKCTIDDACFSAGMKALHRAGQIDKRDSYFLSNYK